MRAKFKNRVQTIETLWESDNINIFWEKEEENQGQILVLKIVLGTLAYILEKVSNFHHSVLFVWAMTSLLPLAIVSFAPCILPHKVVVYIR